MSGEVDPRVLWQMLPPRPDPITGEPAPQRAPSRVRGEKPECDRYRESRLLYKPIPPAGMGPVLAWHRDNLRVKVLGFSVCLTVMLIGATAVSAFDGAPPLEWMRYWQLWIIVLAAPLLMVRPWRTEVMSAGVDWVRVETLRRKSNQFLRTYDLTKVEGYVGSGRVYVQLWDRDGYMITMLLTQWQQDQRIWDLVYNGILHSVANGAEVQKGIDRTLGFEGSPAMRLNRLYPETPAPHLLQPRDTAPRPAIDLPTCDGEPATEDEQVRRSGVLRGSADGSERGSVWLERRDGGTISVLWPQGFQARFVPLELLDGDGRVLAKEGDRILLTGTIDSEQVLAVASVEAL